MDYSELVKQAQNGNTEAFGRIYDLFAERLFRFVYLKIQNQEQTEDILQEVFIKAWQAMPQFDASKGNLSSWLYKIATNAANDHFRKLCRKPPAIELNEQLEIASGPDSASDVIWQTDMETVKKALLLLPPLHRQVLELRFMQDLTIQETAQTLSKTQLAIRITQHRALKKLRDLISKLYAAPN